MACADDLEHLAAQGCETQIDLARAPLGLWALAAGLCVTASGASLLLERALPARVRRTPVRAPAEGATAAVSG